MELPEDSRKAVFSRLRRHKGSLAFGALAIGIFVLLLVKPVPSRAELTAISGPLVSYSVEKDDSWVARNLSRRPSVYVLFRLANYPGRFWNTAVQDYNVGDYFKHPGQEIRIYRLADSRVRLINGDGEKTYGFSVDGIEIWSPDSALNFERFFAYGMFPLLGFALFAVAIYQWKKENRLSS